MIPNICPTCHTLILDGTCWCDIEADLVDDPVFPADQMADELKRAEESEE